MLRKKTGGRKTEKAKSQTILCFDGVVCGSLPGGVFGWPWSGVGGPLHGIVLEDERGARKVAG